MTTLKFRHPTTGEWLPLTGPEAPVVGPEGQVPSRGPVGPAGADAATPARGARGPAGPQGDPGAAADSAAFLTSLLGDLRDTFNGGNSDLLDLKLGLLFAPVAPPAAGREVVDPPDRTTQTDWRSGVISGTEIEVVNPSPYYALKVLVDFSVWADFKGLRDVSLFVVPPYISGYLIPVGDDAGRYAGPSYKSVESHYSCIIPPNGRATLAGSVYLSAVSTRGIGLALARMSVVPVGYELSGSSYVINAAASYTPPPVVERPPVVVTTPKPASITSSASSNSVRTFKGTGSPNTWNWDGKRCYYGRYDSTNGDQRSIALFPSSFRSSLRAIPSGKITSMKLTFTNLHTFNNSGGSVKVYMATQTSLPDTMGGESGELLGTVNVPHAGSATLTISASDAEKMRASGTGVRFYGTTDAQSGYGYLDGKTVKLAVNYTT
jgi:hypothetical protein